MKTKLFAGAFGVMVLGLAVGCDDGGSTGGAGGTSSSTKASSGSAMTTTSGMTTGSSMVKLDCASYCTEVMANCTGANAQYPDAASCAAACATFPAGTLADTSGNTLGCRLYHGGDPAKGMPGTHCIHAGPLGDGACGDACDGFCQIAVAECATQHTSVATCKTECMGFPNTAPYNATVTAGDSLACRTYHLLVATADAQAAVHCPHSQEMSDPCQ